MTNENIIKALECCVNDDCDNCPDTFGNCEHNTMRNALDLIMHQQAEIDRLTNELHGKVEYIHEQLEIINDLKNKYNKNILNTQERIDILRKIKQHREPPFLKNDIYYHREPWQKFGSVTSGICMEWCWYRDDIILSKVTDKDLVIAMMEFEAMVKSEVIEEFVERLKRKRHNYFPRIEGYCVSKKVVLLEDIISLSKEMTGDEK